MRGVCVTVHKCEGQKTIFSSQVSFHIVGSRGLTQILRLGSKYFAHLTIVPTYFGNPLTWLILFHSEVYSCVFSPTQNNLTPYFHLKLPNFSILLHNFGEKEVVFLPYLHQVQARVLTALLLTITSVSHDLGNIQISLCPLVTLWYSLLPVPTFCSSWWF